jgi:hypothetical protein
MEDIHFEGKTVLKWLSESCGCIQMAKDKVLWQALMKGRRFCGQLNNYQLIKYSPIGHFSYLTDMHWPDALASFY